MVRASKSTTASKATKAKKEVAAPEVAPTPAPAPEPVAAPAPAPVEEEEVSVEAKLAEFSSKLQQVLSVFNTLKSDYKTLAKTVERELKAARKASKKKRAPASGDRKPSGFTAPTKISDELAKFLGKEPGTEMARTAVSKEIHNYIKSNNLSRQDNGRYINPDDKLCKILNCKKTDEISYFNLQTYLKRHFKKQGEQ
jgi:chromatin remodeling complex protein RSC6